ncbi:hypothetical protein I317_01560 [Kwoniella heveanensis CBS 569]|nr:hypothetical protein I317_01560 [Kwoniella heveanensis CBS 569]
MTTTSSILPLDLRLRTLEARLFGVPPSLVDSTGTSSSSIRHQKNGLAGASDGRDGHESDARKGATRRMREIEDSFDRLAGQSDGLKRLLEGYEQYRALLALPTNQPSSSLSATAEGSDPHPHHSEGGTESATTSDFHESSSLSESDLLPDRVKLSMVLEAAGDIRGAERDLREIDLLRKKGVEGSGSLEDLLPHRPLLIKAVKEAQTRSAELDRARRDVGQLLMRYNEFTNATSGLFVDIHHRLEYLEARVWALERKKKKELAERY